MQMVAAAKLKRAQEAAEQARAYAMQLDSVLTRIAASVEISPTTPKLLTGTGQDKIHLLIVATSERGLAGGFNSAIVRKARLHILELEKQGKTVKILTIGKKGREQLKRDFSNYFVDHVDMSSVKKLAYVNASDIAKKVISMYENGEFDIATFFYSDFKSVMSQVPVSQQLIPAHIESEETVAQSGKVEALYDYEPTEEEILTELLPKNIATQVYRGLLENAASEQGARMSAMDSATRNAGEMIDKLTIQYNRSRQAAITKELIEIISGAEAL
jgi:F-type H+-transporting ATPase subunit gamma